ncbi:hypothetical protein J5N97_009678 [Dioscorea zingiberensis]|uniref:Integrase catalytic domain-containing protein n=1 Tax=Dioscorea zingiberensis TaxID=325984 RepID=A0A9D5HM40_9LILI|nr:hypothetical protein J5N97_009678 [Dioscorea zingiberensis]
MSTSSSVSNYTAAATSSSMGILPTPSFGHLINVKLTRTNYLLWKAQFLPYLRNQQLLGYVDGTIVAPEKMITQATAEGAMQTPNTTYQQWLQQDQLVLSALLSSLSEEILGQVLFLSTSAEVWEALGRMFSSGSKARVMQIRMQLANVKKGDLSITDYFNRVKSLADTLSSIGLPLRDDEVVSYMLAGLGEEYDSLVTSVTTRIEPFSLTELYAHMLSFEMRKEQQQGAFQITTNNVIRFNNRGGKDNYRGKGRSTGNSGGRGKQTFSNNSSSVRGNRPQCQVCGKIGHVALKCYHRFDHSYQVEETHVAALASTSSYGVDTNWYTDSGATDHITSELDKMSVRDKYQGNDQVQTANGACMPISHIGQTHIPTSNRSLKLQNILHVPSAHRNLISVHRLTSDNNVYLEFHPNYFLVKDRATKKLLLQGKCEKGLYPLMTSSSVLSKTAFTGVKVPQDLWHCRLGHPSSAIVDRVIHSNDLPVISNKGIPHVCNVCQEAKSHQLPFSISNKVSSSPLDPIFTDVWGPAHTSVGGFRYYVSFIDDFSKFVWFYPIKSKSDVALVFTQFQPHVERLLNKKIVSVQSDGGGEYQTLHKHFQQNGIKHLISCPYTHQQNGSAERKH